METFALWTSFDKSFPALIILIIAVLFGFALGRIIQKAADAVKIKDARKDAVKKSRAVLGGQAGEQIAPYLPAFPCDAGDARFLGKPVDFVAFPGSAKGEIIKEVLFIEVKSGQSKLSERERQIKTAVQNGRVRYVEYRIPEGK